MSRVPRQWVRAAGSATGGVAPIASRAFHATGAMSARRAAADGGPELHRTVGIPTEERLCCDALTVRSALEEARVTCARLGDPVAP